MYVSCDCARLVVEEKSHSESNCNWPAVKKQIDRLSTTWLFVTLFEFLHLKTLSLTNNKTNQPFENPLDRIGLHRIWPALPGVTKNWWPWWYFVAAIMSYHRTIESKHKKHSIRIFLRLVLLYLVNIALCVQSIPNVRTAVVHHLPPHRIDAIGITSLTWPDFETPSPSAIDLMESPWTILRY